MFIDVEKRYIFIASLIALGFFLSCAFFFNLSLLDRFEKKYRPLYSPAMESYQRLEGVQAEAFVPKLMQINLSQFPLFRKTKPISFIFNYDADWNLIVSHVASVQSKNVVEILSQETSAAMRKKDFNFIDTGHHLIMRYRHEFQENPLAYTVIGLQEETFFRQKNYLLLGAAGGIFFLWGALMAFFFFYIRRHEKKKSIPEREDSKKNQLQREKIDRESLPHPSPSQIEEEGKKEREEMLPVIPEKENQKSESSHPAVPLTEEGRGEKTEPKEGSDTIRSFASVFAYRRELEYRFQQMASQTAMEEASRSARGLNEFVEAILHFVQSKFSPEEASLFVVNDLDPLLLEWQGTLNRGEFFFPEGTPPISGDIHPILLSEGKEGRMLFHLIGSVFFRQQDCVVSVPIQERTRIMGALRLISRKEGGFTEKDRFLLAKIADTVGEHLNHFLKDKSLPIAS